MAHSVASGEKVHVVVRSYDLKFWKAAADGVATVRRVTPLGDRVRVEASTDAGVLVFAQFPRRSSLLKGIEPGGREVQHVAADEPVHDVARGALDAACSRAGFAEVLPPGR